MGHQNNTYFPYTEFRNGQKELINDIAEVVNKGEHLVIEAPNGFGKTITVLAGALMAARKNHKKILYCCRTHQQMDRVIEELSAINQQVAVTGVSLRGRTQMCLHEDVLTAPASPHVAMEICRSLKLQKKCEYHENIREDPEIAANMAFQITQSPSTALEIIQIGKDQRVCPYEILKDLLGAVDVTALSYNYLFDQAIRESFLRELGEPLSNFVLVLDEAHNLPEISVSLGSDTLTERVVELAEREAKHYQQPLITDFMKALSAEFQHYKAIFKEEQEIDPSLLIATIKRKASFTDPETIFQSMIRVGEQIHKEQIAHDEIPRSYIYRTGQFMSRFYSMAEDPRFLHSISSYKYRSQELSMKLELVSMDPRTLTVPVLNNVHASVSMSGSLSPLGAYIETIGLSPKTHKRVVKSPFDKSQMLVLVLEGISSAMRYRSQKMYQKIVEKLTEVVSSTPGNTGIFAASYRVLQGLLDADIEHQIDKPFFIEQPRMSSRDNDPLIRRFRASKHTGGGVLLGVIGGRNSEGTDFSGDDMITVAVIGVPYATPTLAVKKQIAYFENEFPGRGRYYAYHLPAIKRASQAAGRPIRSLKDRGVILLFDERFATSYCQKALPSWLYENIEILPDRKGLISNKVKDFFKE